MVDKASGNTHEHVERQAQTDTQPFFHQFTDKSGHIMVIMVL